MLLFVTWSVVLIGLGLVNFRRAKVMTAVFVGVLLLQMFLQVAFVWFYRSEQVAFAWFDRRELVNSCRPPRSMLNTVFLFLRLEIAAAAMYFNLETETGGLSCANPYG